MNTLKFKNQVNITPEISLQTLKEGNMRFYNNIRINRDYLHEMKATSGGQKPFATVLSCIDSRVSSELIFDQGLGDIFSIRIAGNFINDDILGSMEFACKIAQSPLVVLGHTNCGAVKGVCDDAKLGKLTGMLENLKPALNSVTTPECPTKRKSENIDFVNMVSQKNVELSIERILNGSSVISKMQDTGEVSVLGAMYDIHTGEVTFYDN